MQRLVTTWLSHQLKLSDQLKRDGVMAFALRVSLKNVVVANVINGLTHLALHQCGLLPYPLMQALPVALFATTFITFVLSISVVGVIGRGIVELSIERDEFERLSCEDLLSGLMNRRAFFKQLEAAQGAGLLILADIDRFKAINDDYGHVVGDAVIRGVGRVLQEMFEGTNAVLGRIGGEEFAILVPDAARWNNDHPAEKARIAVAAMQVRGVDRAVTISLGVAVVKPWRPAIDVYAAADRVLYLAKTAGRNLVLHEDDICELPALVRSTPAEHHVQQRAG